MPSELLPPVSRRTVLKLGTALTGLAIYTHVSPDRVRAALRAAFAADVVPSLVASVLRADDMLSLRFSFFNLKLLAAGQAGPGDVNTARLVREVSNTAAFFAVEFEPQNIAEQAFFESAEQQATLPTPPVKARIAAPSRLAFRVPDGVTSIPFTLDALLNWDPFNPSVVPVATPKGVTPRAGSKIRKPNRNETAIEVPWRLVLSPHAYSQWDHADDPVTHAGRTELWHTRLETDAQRASAGQIQGPAPARTVRAVWTQSFNKNDKPDPESTAPFLMSLRANDRWQIVRLTSDFGSGFTPQPITVDRLMLSPLGAWTSMRGNWVPPDGGAFKIEQFNHRSTMGRDQYARVVYSGYLFPFGHAASLTVITERKVSTISSGAQKGKAGAYLHQRMFITVKEPERKFTSRDMPFKTVRVTTIKTPDLNEVSTDPKSQIKKTNSNKHFDIDAFWPRVGDQDFQFTIVATDWDGQLSELTAPLPFVSKLVEQGFAISRVRADYLNGPQSRRKRPMQGQKVALGASTAGRPGDTTLEVNAFEFEGWIDFSKNPNFIPKLRSANVRLQAVEQVKTGDLPPPTIEYHPVYLEKGFTGSNAAAELFVRIKDPVELDFGKGNNADRSGGIATPNMMIGGLSRKTGPVGGDLSGPTPPPKFDPKKFFDGASILGGIDLADIINVGQLVGFDQAPKITNRPVYPGNDATKVPEKIETILSWGLAGTQLKSDLPLKIFEPNSSSKFALNATFTTPVDSPAAPDYEIVGDLTNFTINMIGKDNAFLILHFNRVNFTSRQGEKPDVDVDIGEVEFAGILSFVNELKDFLSTGGNGLSIDITPTQVAASYTLGLPTISVGIFSLQNISLSAGVVIPFTGKPFQAFFAFCKREAQFLLTYTIFGGGGYFQLTVGESPNPPHELGIQLLEVGLEFGANCSLDIGVASGSVELMAGIYFAIGNDPECGDVAQLTGYVRLGGELEVLGIITLSLEFKMSLTYDFTDDSVFGQATLVVEVEVLFFSADVELSVEKKFGGGNGQAPCLPGGASRIIDTTAVALQNGASSSQPVTFEDLMTAANWTDEYVPAFATAAFS